MFNNDEEDARVFERRRNRRSLKSFEACTLDRETLDGYTIHRSDLLLFDYYCRHDYLVVKCQLTHVYLDSIVATMDIWIQFLSCMSTLPFLKVVRITSPCVDYEHMWPLKFNEYSELRFHDHEIFLGNVFYELITRCIFLTVIIVEKMGLTDADINLLRKGLAGCRHLQDIPFYWAFFNSRRSISRDMHYYLDHDESNEDIHDIIYKIQSNEITTDMYKDSPPLFSNNTMLRDTSLCIGQFAFWDMDFDHLDKIISNIMAYDENVSNIKRISLCNIYPSSQQSNQHLPLSLYKMKNLKSLIIVHCPFLLNK